MVLAGSNAALTSASGELKYFLPYRLPQHETVYAMTVHKSQGSEFENIFLILPDKDSPVLSRQLIYTAITRATKTVTIFGKEEIIRNCMSRVIKRKSGLHDSLWIKKFSQRRSTENLI